MKRGRLDCVASDHHPHGPGGDPGVPSAELMFPLLLSAVRFGRLSLERLVSLCSEAPARILGLPHKGRIEAGADADLVLFSEGELTRVAPDELLSSAGWSPYADRETATKPDLVMVRGVVTARAGRIVGDSPQGRALRG
jgi:dihydroorotase